jgi:hypothetical protein
MPSQSILPLGTASVIVGVETDERAVCRYNPTPTDFASMTQFTRTGGIQHTTEATGLLDNQNYLYYVQCRDEAGNLNSTDYLINFSVGSYSNGGGPTPYCGDNNCDANESCSSCEADCGVCAPPGSDEPQPPANEILIQNFNAGDLDGGGSYLYESFDRYSDAVSDVTRMADTSDYFTSPRTAYWNQGNFLLVTGYGGSGLATRNYFTEEGQQDWVTPYVTGSGAYSFGSYSGTLVVQFQVRFPDANGIMNGGKFFDLIYNVRNDRIQFSIKKVAGVHPTQDRDFRGNPSNAGPYPGREIGAQPVGPYPDDINDGNWHRVTLAYKPNTIEGTPSSRDGLFRAWIDGIKVMDVSESAIGVTPLRGTKEWCDGADVDSLGAGSDYQISLLLYPNYVNDLTAAFNIDFDEIKVWTE